LVFPMVLFLLLADLVGSRHRLGVPDRRAFQTGRDGRRRRPSLGAYPHRDVLTIQLCSHCVDLEPAYLQYRGAHHKQRGQQTSPRRNKSYRHHDIHEREVWVSQPSRDIDRLLQRFPTPSPIDNWEIGSLRRNRRISLTGRQCLGKYPKEDGDSSVRDNRGATKDEASFVVTLVQRNYGRETFDRKAM
jgi:hypothetical protein